MQKYLQCYQILISGKAKHKEYDTKALLTDFRLNNHALEFRPQSPELFLLRNTLYSIINRTKRNHCSTGFI